MPQRTCPYPAGSPSRACRLLLEIFDLYQRHRHTAAQEPGLLALPSTSAETLSGLEQCEGASRSFLTLSLPRILRTASRPHLPSLLRYS